MATGHSRSISNGSPRHLLSPEAKRRNGVGLEYSVLAPYGMLSDKTQFPTVWACACTKGCRKVYEKKGSGWSAIMDHLVNAHGIAKDATHPTAINKQQKQARDESKKRALDAGMTEGRFQAICTTRYIIRRLLPFSHVGTAFHLSATVLLHSTSRRKFLHESILTRCQPLSACPSIR